MNNLDKNWRNAKKSIFRLEGRSEYRVPEQQAQILKWKKDELDMSGDKTWQQWLKSVKNTKAKGITVQRVRVAPNPLTDYFKFEIALWQKFSVQNEEELFFINAAEYQEIVAAMGFNPKDFWLFDEDKLLMFNYNPSGQFSGDIAITDGGMIRRYSGLKQELIKRSVPLETFLKKNPIQN